MAITIEKSALKEQLQAERLARKAKHAAQVEEAKAGIIRDAKDRIAVLQKCIKDYQKHIKELTAIAKDPLRNKSKLEEHRWVGNIGSYTYILTAAGPDMSDLDRAEKLLDMILDEEITMNADLKRMMRSLGLM